MGAAVIVEVQVRELISENEMGFVRYSLMDTYEDDDEIGWRRRWLRQVIVPRLER